MIEQALLSNENNKLIFIGGSGCGKTLAIYKLKKFFDKADNIVVDTNIKPAIMTKLIPPMLENVKKRGEKIYPVYTQISKAKPTISFEKLKSYKTVLLDEAWHPVYNNNTIRKLLSFPNIRVIVMLQTIKDIDKLNIKVRKTAEEGCLFVYEVIEICENKK